MRAEADYAAIAPRFDQRYKVVDYRGVEKALFEFVEPAAKVDVLEVGCGTGHWLRILERESGRRVGIDPSPEMLSRARVSGSGSQLARASAEALPLADKSFDRLFCINAFHHFRDKTRFLSEAHRVLRPGGRCLIVGLDPHATPLIWWVYDYFEGTLASDRARYSPSAEIRGAMAAAGFVDCSTVPAQRMSGDMSVKEAETRGFLHATFTSQLSLLSDGHFQAGLDRLRAASAAATSIGKELSLRTDFALYATEGHKAAGEPWDGTNDPGRP